MNTQSIISNILMTVGMLVLGAGCSEGIPSNEIIQEDWRSYWATHFGAGSCAEFLQPVELSVLGKRMDGTAAIVLVEAKAEWASQSNSSPSFSDLTPCYGFQQTNGKVQTQERKLFYEKYDSGWRLAAVEGVHHGRVVRHPIAQ